MADPSIEEMNRVRVALGMKPLPMPNQPSSGGEGPVFRESKKDGASSGSDEEPGSTLDSRHAAASNNWQKLQEEQQAKARREERKVALQKAREKAQREAKLEGKGLGDADEDVDTKTWLKQQKKRQKAIEKARKLEEELAEREKLAEYTEADLAGVRVGHEIGQFEEGEEQILTLKDATVDEEEDDELENVNLRDKEKLGEKLELKKKKPVYNPNELAENGESSILAQYDEEIHGKKKNRFTLDGKGSTKEVAMRDVQAGSDKPKTLKISLDLLKDDAPLSDYVEPSEIKMKKPKKPKKSKSSKKRVLDDDDIFAPAEEAPVDPNAMEVDTNGKSSESKKRSLEDSSFVDDEDLQASLAMQRRAALKQRKKAKFEDFARQLRDEGSATPGVIDTTEAQDDEPGLVIDETSEFVANLQKPGEEEERKRKPSRGRSRTTSAPPKASSPDSDGDVDMDRSYNDTDEATAKESADRGRSTSHDITHTGLEEEASLNDGIGATLKMLRERGLVQRSAGDLTDELRHRERFLTEKRKRQEEAERRARLQRERDRQSGKLDRMSAREREDYARHNNTVRDQIEARQMAEIFNKEYKPNIDLKYVDEYGRHMAPKEAFKNLSHQFHGKGSGKQKTEKKLKNIEDEKKREAMSSLDSSQHTGMNSALNSTARKNRQAGVRLQ
ncbi:SART-1 protein [Lineolata rhizophorae]|uniref:SART-1 protein n=1 Tax=Lineolata rhizophorae TaxID=578093 RepID=A0A6A6P997_9PEZI|nr:SART-1 protein [Lineolata rhizophorae]